MRSLLDVVAGYSPLPIFVEHGRDRFHRRLLVFEAALVLNHHILAIRRARQRLRVSGALEFARQQLAQRIAAPAQRALPLLLGDGGLEKLRGLLPTVRVFSGVDQGPATRPMTAAPVVQAFAGRGQSSKYPTAM